MPLNSATVRRAVPPPPFTIDRPRFSSELILRLVLPSRMSITNLSTVRLYLPLFILIALRTGARKEAILSLRLSQVDLEAGRIDFNPAGRRRTN